MQPPCLALAGRLRQPACWRKCFTQPTASLPWFESNIACWRKCFTQTHAADSISFVSVLQSQISLVLDGPSP